MLQDIKVIIFDLDGTVYQDTHHFKYYAQRLCEKLPQEVHEAFWHDYDAAVGGTHALQIGTIYDVKEDLILKQKDNEVVAGLTWDGNEVSKEKLQEIYGGRTLSYDFNTMLNVGDLWWIPGSISRHYGINDEDAQTSFGETRLYMMTEKFKMEQIPGFKALLHSLADKVKVVLLTNSPEEDSEVILHKVGIADVFDYKIFNGKKPIHTKKHLQSVKDRYDVDFHEILSIGDNAINEIIPAKELGCKTILIDPHHIFAGEGMANFADMRVENIEGYMELLKQK